MRYLSRENLNTPNTTWARMPRKGANIALGRPSLPTHLPVSDSLADVNRLLVGELGRQGRDAYEGRYPGPCAAKKGPVSSPRVRRLFDAH